MAIDRFRANMGEKGIDRFVEGLGQRDRRRVCRYLAERDEPVASLAELARYVTREQDPNAAPGPVPGTYRDVRTKLHHVHLPKLAAADIVEYDPDRRFVEPDAGFHAAVEFLRAVEQVDERPGKELRQ